MDRAGHDENEPRRSSEFKPHFGVLFRKFGARSSRRFNSTPAIEIAWRLAFDQWVKGYATEAARAVVRDAFDRRGLAEIVAVTTPDNLRSRRVMEKLGMVYSPSETFEHPRVPEGNPLRTHIVYRLRS